MARELFRALAGFLVLQVFFYRNTKSHISAIGASILGNTDCLLSNYSWIVKAPLDDDLSLFVAIRKTLQRRSAQLFIKGATLIQANIVLG